MVGSEVWYVSYGSNMSAARLTRYLEGGQPDGALHTHSGARDPSPPKASMPLTLPGTVFFAGESPVWTGGRAYYDPTVPGPTPARAYFVTAEQFEDIRAQEPPVYDRLLEIGTHDNVPLLTFTSSFGAAQVRQTEPSPAYLATIAAGLREAHGWDEADIADYLGRIVISPLARRNLNG